MLINCPICSTAIEVDENHAGLKGRCVQCNAKFIIPSGPDQEIEILEIGQKPEEAVVNEAPETSSPPVLKMPAAPAYAPPKPVVIKKSGSPMGMLVLVVLIALCGIGFYLVKSGKMIQISSGDAEGNKTVVTKKIYVQASGKNSKDDKKVIAEESSSSLDVNKPFALPDSIDETFELSDENKERALKFLISEEFQKRESVYDSFRELGDRFKETYEKLLTQARSQKLVSFKETLSELSNYKETSDSFENDFQAWKDAASAGVKLVMTKWKEQDAENFKQNIGAMNDAVKSAEDRYQVLSKAFKGQQFEENDALNNFVDLFNEFETEIAWSKGEDSSESVVLADLVEEIKNQDAVSNVADGSLDDIKLFIETNEAILNYNDQVNWGTSLYKKLLLQMNQKRVALGFTALKINEQLTNASEMHSGDMHFQEFYSHKSFDGSSYADRAKSAGFVGKVYGEFLYRASVDPISAFNSWWITDTQRIMMLDKETNAIGVGRAENYWTVNIGKLGG